MSKVKAFIKWMIVPLAIFAVLMNGLEWGWGMFQEMRIQIAGIKAICDLDETISNGSDDEAVQIAGNFRESRRAMQEGKSPEQKAFLTAPWWKRWLKEGASFATVVGCGALLKEKFWPKSEPQA